MATPKPAVTPPKTRKPRQSAVKLGAKQTARITSKRAIKDVIKSKTTNPLLAAALIAAVGAVASYYINKA